MNKELTKHGNAGAAVESIDTGDLWRLAEIAESLGAESIAEQARELAQRVAEGRFYVACVGQFKRGKSTLIGALIGENVLPTGFIPVTAVPTVIRYGEQRGARIRGENGAWFDIAISDLEQYVSEEHNPENAKKISAAEVFVPSPLLASGMCFVDTPGLGSVFGGNTAATHAFIPHIDAALIVIGADPPLAGDELALVISAGQHVRDLIVVLNKADRTTQEERSAAVAFAERVLEKKLNRSIGPILQVSALERLQNQGPEREWRKLIERLEELDERSGRQLILSACARGLDRLGEQLLVIIREQRGALQRPIEESERRIATMKVTIGEAERSMRELDYLFMAEQRAISDRFLDRRKAFVATVSPVILKEFEALLRSVPRTAGPRYRRCIMNEGREIVRRHLLPWLEPEEQEGERQYRMLAQRFVDMGNAFLTKMAKAGLAELASMPHALDPETGFRTRSEFSFRNFFEISQPATPLRWIADVFLVWIGLRSRIENQARQFISWLLEVNSSRVQNDVLNRVQESRGRLEVEIRKLLHEVSRVAVDALINARRVRDEGTPAVERATQYLDSLEAEIREMIRRKQPNSSATRDNLRPASS